MVLLAVVLNIILIAIDQFTKHVAVNQLEPIGSITVINGIFSFTYTTNKGAAWGLMEGGRWFFVVFTIIVLSAVGYYYVKLPKTKIYTWVRVALILISAGAIGNFIDRLTKGFVVDFFHATFIDFPIFNVADVYVVVGTSILSIILLFFIKNEAESGDKI